MKNEEIISCIADCHYGVCNDGLFNRRRRGDDKGGDKK